MIIFLATGASASAQTGKSVVIGSMIDRPNALIVLNPPDKNQGMLVPQLTTTQRLAIRPASPQEDGLLLFDITEKSFYFWKNNAWVKGLGLEASDPLSHGTVTIANIASGPNNTLLTTNAAGNVTWSTVPVSLDAQDMTFAMNVLSLSNDATPVNLNNLTASGQVTGTINNLTIAANTISANHIQNGSININKFASAGVTDANKVYSTSATGIPQLESKANLLSGVAASGDLNGSYPAPNVGRLQGNAVAPVTLTAADAGKLLVWNGTNWMPQVVSGVSPISRYAMIDPSEFTNLRRSDRKDKDNIIMFDDNSTYVTTIKKDEGPQIIAPLQLPDGATIEEVTLYYMDRETKNVVFNLFRKTATGPNESVVNSWSSSGSSGAIRTSLHVPIPGNQVVDNNTYSYRIVVNLDQSTDVNDSNDANLRVYAIKVKYLP